MASPFMRVENPFMKIKPIKGFEGSYYITNTGITYSCKRSDPTSLYPLKPIRHSDGYLTVKLYDENHIRHHRYNHRSVAEAFVENPDPENKTCVNHKNCVRTWNHADNLEWVTPQENNDYMFKTNHVIRDDKGRFLQNSSYYHKRNRNRKRKSE